MSIINRATEFCNDGELVKHQANFAFLNKTVQSFLLEEVGETVTALNYLQAMHELTGEFKMKETEDLLDGFGDVAFIALNGIYKTFRMIGKTHKDAQICTEAVMQGICNANLAKIAGGAKFNENGKIIKPDGWQEPRYNDLITHDVKDTIEGGVFGYQSTNFAEN